MLFDLLAAIEFTISAAIAIAVMSVGFGETRAARLRIVLGLGLWFMLVVLLAASKALTYPQGLGVPGLGIAVALPIIILSALVLRSTSLKRALQNIPLHWLIGVHAIRVLGVAFLLLYAAGRLPAPFAPVAGWGDILAGLEAVPVAWLAYRQVDSARPLILFWNTFGVLDLVTAIGLGATSSPGPIRLFYMEPSTTIMTTLPWLLIPAFLVPLLISIHLAVFYRLSHARAYAHLKKTAVKPPPLDLT